MAVTQYIGSRYVPLFADPIDWDITRAYEPLTIVYYQGNSYTSRQAVPTGIDVTNTSYWALTGNYNAQVEQYRREVQTFDGRITANAQAIADEVTERMQEDTAIRALISTLNSELATEKSAREDADTQIRNDFAQQDSALDSKITTLRNQSTFYQGSEVSSAVFFGDSVTYGDLGRIDGQQQPRAQKPWPTVYGESAGIATIDNRAVNGSTSLTLPGIIENLNFASYNQCFVAHGLNDWSYSTPIGTPFDVNTSTFCGCINTLIRQAFAQNPEITLIMCTPFYAQSLDTEFASSYGFKSENNLGYSIVDYANAVRAIAEANNVPCVEMRESLCINNANHARWINDDVHPNQDGYTKIGKFVAKQVGFNSKQGSAVAMQEYVPRGSNIIGVNDFPANNTTPFIPYGESAASGNIVSLNNSYALSRRYYTFSPNKVYSFHCALRASEAAQLIVQLNRLSDGSVFPIYIRTPHIASAESCVIVNTVFTVPEYGKYRIDLTEQTGNDVYISNLCINEGMVSAAGSIGASDLQFTKWKPKNVVSSLGAYSGLPYITFSVDASGFTHIEGCASASATIAGESKIFEIPKCYCSDMPVMLFAHDTGGNAYRFSVMPDGTVNINREVGSGTILVFDSSFNNRAQSIVTECDVVSNQA